MHTVPDFTAPHSPAHARQIQSGLRERLVIADEFGTPEIIGGVDVGYDVRRGMAKASLITLRLADLSVVEQLQAETPVDFPYVPGLLSFREIPAILEAIRGLARLPDLWLVDGQGIAHPRRMGIAAHLGVLLDQPTIGVAKSRLTGEFSAPGSMKGNWEPLTDKGERIGTVLRSKDNVQPLFVSPGHRVGIDSAVAITLQCLTRYRLPEPTRLADKLSKYRAVPQPALL